MPDPMLDPMPNSAQHPAQHCLPSSPKRKAAGIAAAFGLLLALSHPLPALAGDSWYPEDGDHPLRIVHYVVGPIGRILEWTVTRPLAYVGSKVAPYQHINAREEKICSRERPGRSCTDSAR